MQRIPTDLKPHFTNNKKYKILHSHVDCVDVCAVRICILFSI